ncbi:TonB-dependent receptor [Sphingobium aromaticivastans]|uniref:TonB-dependent receptor n=1 Tax=Sphingobium aromaticivastans TaxID=1778665 RepID=UPI00301742E5
MIRQSLAFFFLTTSVAAWAQSAQPGAAADTDSAELQAPAAGEIIVTAQKREERLQDVGISVAAFGAETLAQNRVENVTDLTKIVPGLTATPSPTNTPVFTLRGVGFFESSVSSSPNVAVYIDQAPLSLPVYTSLTAFDLERVEVLKGPQGTLFGANATGGAINFVAAKPTQTLAAGATLSYGRFNALGVDAFISGPLSDTLAARFAIKASRSDGWQKSYTRDDRLGKQDTIAARLLFDWKPTDKLDVSLNVNGWLDRSDTQAPQLARPILPDDLQAPVGACGPTGCVTADHPILLYAPAPRNGRAADWSPIQRYRPKQDNKFFQTILTMNYEVADDISLTSLTNYIHYDQFKTSNLSGLALLDVENAADVAQTHDFTQEIRLSNSNPGRLRWVVGGNLALSESSQEVLLVYPEASTGCCTIGFTADTYTSKQKKRYLAGFANLQWEVVDDLTLKGGVRYTDGRHSAIDGEYDARNYTEIPGANGFAAFANNAFANAYVPLFCPGTTFQPIAPGGAIAIDPMTCQSGVYSDVLREENTSWSAGIDYKPIPGLLLFANVSKGYKAGAFPAASAGSWEAYYPVRQEYLTDYEAGFKATLPGGLGIVNGAAFYYDYRNKQLRGKLVNPFFGALDHLVGIPKSTIKGAEIDATIAPVRNLTLRVAATYLDAKIKKYNGVTGTQSVNGLLLPVYGSYAGVPLPFSPKWQGSLGADYAFLINDGMEAFVGGTLSAQTKSYGSPEIDPKKISDAYIKGYAILDLRAGLRDENDRWNVTVYGKNVTNSYYWTNRLRNFDTVVQYAGRPVEWGISVGWKY